MIDDRTWRVEDVFVPRGLTRAIVVAERFHDVCLNHGITNLKLVRLHEFMETFGLEDKTEASWTAPALRNVPRA